MSNHVGYVTLGDFVTEEMMLELHLSEEVEDFLADESEFLSETEAGWQMGESMSQWDIWKRMWLFGIIVDDDLNYYIPDDYDTTVALLPKEVA
jgi:hypothetical protein